MQLLLNIIYVIFLVVVSPWLLWRAVFQNKSRRGWKQKLFGSVPSIEKPEGVCCIWFHAVSVGEVNLLRPIIERILAREASVRIAISTSTETGFDLARRKYDAHTIFFCPMDFSWAIKNVINRIKPDLLVLTELELWPNLVSVSRQNDVPVAVVNARLSALSFKGYSRMGWLVRNVLGKINMFAAQNRTYADRFVALGCDHEKIRVSGNVKFDGAKTKRDGESADRLRRLYALDEQQHIFVAGSTQPDEDAMAIEVFERLSSTHPQLRLVIVPRHPEKVAAACDLLSSKGISFVRRSETADSGCPEICCNGMPVLIVDVIGELSAWWSLADVGYVGGSMASKRGGQNMIEPAALGVPVSFGPNTRNFQAVVESLLSVDAAAVVRDGEGLAGFVAGCIKRPDDAREMAERALKVVTSQQGAADATVEMLLQLLPQLDSQLRKLSLPAA